MRSRRPASLARSLCKSRVASLSAALCISIAATQTLAAQSAHRWSVQASGLYVGVGGSAYEGTSNGPGGEVQVRYSPSAFSVGVGLQGSWHKFKEEVNLEGVDGVALVGGFIEPRYVIAIGSDKAAPYIAARVAYLRQQADATTADGDVSVTADGGQINGGGGVLFRMSPRVNLDLGATFGAINFGKSKATFSSGGQTAEFVGDKVGTGTNFVIRVGLSIGLGH